MGQEPPAGGPTVRDNAGVPKASQSPPQTEAPPAEGCSEGRVAWMGQGIIGLSELNTTKNVYA